MLHLIDMDPVIQLLQPVADAAPESLNAMLSAAFVLTLYVMANLLALRANPPRESQETLLAKEGIELIDPNKPRAV